MMAMMMAGRVLLVCALCVLWCGAGCGVFADQDEELSTESPGGRSSGGDPLETQELEKPVLHGADSEIQSPVVEQPQLNHPQDLRGAATESLGEGVEEVENEVEDDDDEKGRGKGKDGKDTRTTEKAEKQKSLTKDRGTLQLTSQPERGITPAPPRESLQVEGEEGPPASGGDSRPRKPAATPSAPELLLTLTSIEGQGQGTPSETPPGPTTTTTNGKPAGEASPTASTGSQTATETTSTTSPSNAKVALGAAEKPLGNRVPNQQKEETETPDSMKDAPTSHPAETKATSISTTGSGGAQKNEDKVDNGDQRPNSKEPQDGLEDGNTDDAPTASEVEPQTPETDTTQKNATSKSGDSDGSTAVSQTTSPLLLLLLVVACAAAAAVVAA
ncbi:mucin-associated surface protein (MASP), putative [Trypanosoma cruzi]|uniref:Mucin-associated surface protein (MASP), putative n=1 Tax=Trypanosoma cruzi (strain CL Brener) TaxID=353153 RepID=Q4D265_TRYCC|nr:mucin-associated surface protein (MASP), putative [Trypanosoma cruzi]EAN86614.1 mucin-associated surface protein (MASP), putative [Trypanosoma cruzi]|eukprot:XP_808465.1 mucin-associated surface protein (MASP) [Trypanosoma cruzi strain CL Brener]